MPTKDKYIHEVKFKTENGDWQYVEIVAQDAPAAVQLLLRTYPDVFSSRTVKFTPPQCYEVTHT